MDKQMVILYSYLCPGNIWKYSPSVNIHMTRNNNVLNFVCSIKVKMWNKSIEKVLKMSLLDFHDKRTEIMYGWYSVEM